MCEENPYQVWNCCNDRNTESKTCTNNPYKEWSCCQSRDGDTNWCCVSEGHAMVKAVGVELDLGRCVGGLEGWRNKLIVGFEEVDGQVSLTVTVNKESKQRMEASALKRLVEREKAEKRITDQAKAAGFVMGSSVCSLLGSTVYDGKVTLIDAQTGLSVTFSDGDVKQYTIEQLREAIQVGQATRQREKEAREKAAREKAAREKAARVSSFFVNFFVFDPPPSRLHLFLIFSLSSHFSFSMPLSKIVSHFYIFFFQGGKSKFFNAVLFYFCVIGRRQN